MALALDVEDRWRLAWSVVEREAGEAHIDSDARLSPGATRCAEGVVESIDARHLLELGSGASTVRLAALCRDGSRTLDSVDHDPHYFAITQEQLDSAGVSDWVRLHHAPIAPAKAGGYIGLGYRLTNVLKKSDFDFALIDGPPALDVGRFMTLLSIWPHLTVGAVVLLDDAGRVALERRWISEWSMILGSSLRVEVHDGYGKGLALLQKQSEGALPMHTRIAWPYAVRVARWIGRGMLRPIGSAS